jgi:two-component system cell cycle sensor histidine kinase/response regulator CckA
MAGEDSSVGLSGSGELERALRKAQDRIEELEARASLYETLIDQSLSGIYLIDKEERYIYANPSYCEIVGRPWEELCAGDSLAVIAPEEREFVRDRLRRRLAGEKVPSEYEISILRPDGSRRSVWVKAMRVMYQGQPAVLGNLVDITLLRKREEELRESEERFRTAFMNAAVGITLVTPDGICREVNPAMARILGYEPQELVGKRVADFTHPDDLEKRAKFVDDLLSGRIPWGEQERRLIHKDGSTVWVRIWVSVQRDSAGNPLHFISLVQDITAQRRAENALRESEERYRNLVEMLPEGLWVHRNGIILYVNPAMVRLLGASREEELLGRSIYDFVHPESRDSVRERTEEVQEKGVTVPLKEQKYISLDGSVVDVETLATAVPFHGERAVLAVYRDIRERKRQEQERKRLEERFLVAQKMEAVGILAGGVAHNFNNLLMAIQGNASLMLMDLPEDHPHREKLLAIQEAVKSGAELTRQLLGFARGGKYEVRPININTVVEEMAHLFGRTRKEITIHKTLASDLWTVEADRGQMEQVLMNLFVNAADAMPRGGELFLETQNVELDEDYVRPFSAKPGKYVRISVTDTGVGMDEETQRRIFEPFFTTKSLGRGTGLGLATVYGIIKAHEGIITVYSKPGEGSSFHIYLPASPKEPAREFKFDEGIARGSGTILVIDDEPMILKVADHLLRALGYRVITASGGKEGLRIYRERGLEIDLVILDMIMPDMEGGEVFESLKRMNSQIKVLLSSGYSINGRAREILKRGCVGFLQKPFTLAELSQKVKDALARP